MAQVQAEPKTDNAVTLDGGDVLGSLLGAPYVPSGRQVCESVPQAQAATEPKPVTRICCCGDLFCKAPDHPDGPAMGAYWVERR